jgi:nuclear pore complex protein Nup205
MRTSETSKTCWTRSRVVNKVGRAWQQVRSHRTKALQKLTYNLGKLDVDGDQYTINDDFQQGALQLANDLNLDELDAARIFFEVQDETESSGRSAITNSIVRFHQRRKTLLDCLQLLLQLSADEEQDEALRADLQAIVAQITQPDNGQARYAQRCLSGMDDIKNGLQALLDSLNRVALMGPEQQAEARETIEYQRVSLVKQHETLGLTMMYLVKENHSAEADFEKILNTLRQADKYDNLLCMLIAQFEILAQPSEHVLT